MSEPSQSPERSKLARQLVAAAEGFCRRGWCLATAGNFSAALSRDPVRILITQSSLPKGALGENDFVEVNAHGEALTGGTPSAEALLHARIVEALGAGAVLHTHSVAGTLLGEHFLPKGGFWLSGYEMIKAFSGVRSHETQLFVPVLANSQDMNALAGQMESLLPGEPPVRGFLIAGHGLYTWGATVAEAQRHVEAFEFLFECLARRTSFQAFEGR